MVFFNSKKLSIFNFKKKDSFTLVKKSDGSTVNIDVNGISWPKDVGNKFKKGPKSNTTQWINPEDGNFIFSLFISLIY